MTADVAISKLREIIRRKHLAWSTEETYSYWLGKYCAWLESACPSGDSTTKVTAFLTQLAHEDYSASTQNQALQALLMFYREVVGCELGRVDALRAKRPVHVRYSPSVAEVRALLAAVRDLGGYPTRLIVHLLYGCGLRVNEPLDLRIKDVDLASSRLTIHGKGGKTRVVPLPCSLSEPMRRQIAVASARWEQDAASGIPVPLPHLLSRKYPCNAFARGWYWVFPATGTCSHPRTGETVRYRCLDTNIQRAVRSAAVQCRLAGMVTPHCLRHAYATHALHSGAYVRDVQMVLGHASLETTQGYLHAEAGRVASPLDALEVYA
jgi:integron integrase